MAATGGHTLVICHQDEVSELERRKWLCLQCQVISSQSTGTTGSKKPLRLFAGQTGGAGLLSLFQGLLHLLPATRGPKASQRHKYPTSWENVSPRLPNSLWALHSRLYKVPWGPRGGFLQPEAKNVFLFVPQSAGVPLLFFFFNFL